ncbi:hypothetical protein HBI78_013690 [Parastagonospora nodorum]|nr:hypothetical protein HBI78_013690 [Parastagonospora nodorum]
MCAKDDLIERKEELATAESVTAKDSNHVDTFGSDFAFSPPIARGNVSNANILSLIAFIISYRPFADELNIQQSLLDEATVVLIIISVNKTQLLLILGDVARSTPSTLLARFIPTTKIRDPLLKTLENAAKSRILLACADRRTRQYYLTICAILANYEEQVLLTSIKKNRYCMRCTRCLNKGHDDFVHLVNCFGWKHYNFNIHVSLATDTLHLLLKGLLNERFRQVMHSTSLKRFNNKRAFTELIAVISLLFVSKAPFALHFICVVCDLVTLAQYKSHDEDTLAYIQGALERMNVFKEEFRVYRRTLGEEKNFNYPKALDSICTGANSEAHYITIVKQFYSITNKKEYILQICLHNSQRTALLSRLSTTIDIQDRTYSTRVTRIQPYSTKLPLSEVAANIAISNFTHAAAVSRISVQIHLSIKCWQSSGKRHNDPKHCDEEVVRYAPNWQQIGLWRRDYSRTVTDSRVVAQLYLILTIIDHTRYDKDRKHIAYIKAFSKNAAPKRRTLQAFKFYDLSTIIRLVHLILRDLPNLTTYTTMSYYVNNYIN